MTLFFDIVMKKKSVSISGRLCNALTSLCEHWALPANTARCLWL